ncbi:hypothetical protein H072_10475 [Dactylellina haptotyla CBS 200.50]|uniref:Uncharacterized protein n=1 Tax=Dactylellina haptotyla (strain CBS 200.50) TaxID=1284197 RepID=S8BLH3_DACHA|nr:hypothetical protein H072_10475 [Dactylellina haptotyla CBS 200.50]
MIVATTLKDKPDAIAKLEAMAKSPEHPLAAEAMEKCFKIHEKASKTLNHICEAKFQDMDKATADREWSSKFKVFLECGFKTVRVMSDMQSLQSDPVSPSNIILEKQLFELVGSVGDFYTSNQEVFKLYQEYQQKLKQKIKFNLRGVTEIISEIWSLIGKTYLVLGCMGQRDENGPEFESLKEKNPVLWSMIEEKVKEFCLSRKPDGVLVPQKECGEPEKFEFGDKEFEGYLNLESEHLATKLNNFRPYYPGPFDKLKGAPVKISSEEQEKPKRAAKPGKK